MTEKTGTWIVFFIPLLKITHVKINKLFKIVLRKQVKVYAAIELYGGYKVNYKHCKYFTACPKKQII